ncbi:MAG: hypothetical protein ACRD18_04585 [Terriglobia bacterium]
MNLEKIDRWMTQVTDLLTNVSGKLNQTADIDLGLGKKLDRLDDGLEKLISLSSRTERKIDCLADKIDDFASASASTNTKIKHLVGALVRREGGTV